MIRAQALTVDFRRSRTQKLRAVDQLTLEIGRGEFFALLGENGAGKSTAMYCFLGLLRPTDGQVLVDGRPPLLGSDVFERIAYLPEEPHYPAYLTVEETIDYYASLFRRSIPRQRRLDILDRLGLGGFRNLRIAKCSKGMKQKVGIAQCLLNTPDLLFLDEPMRGLDPAGVHDFREILLEMNREGSTIVMNSHILAEVEAVASRVAILHGGRLVAEGDVASLTRADDASYNVRLLAPETPPMVTDVRREENSWVATVARDSFADLVAYLASHSGTLVSCELKRVSLEERFMSIVRREREHV
jgi:ABC-2 type transport system ATP-binding protein